MTTAEKKRRKKLNSYGNTQDQTSQRANTLFDDADDIQRQLDNEARDKIKYGRPKTIWVFHLPAQFPNLIESQSSKGERDANLLFLNSRASDKSEKDTTPTIKDWDYKSQNEWPKMFPGCGGRSQSPVDLPVANIIEARGARKMLFINYDVKPTSLTLTNDGKRVIMYGDWKQNLRPLVYGGAAHSRRYLFHSLSLHWPSEHYVGGLRYPMESHLIHVSSDYKSFEEALNASSKDPQAFLGIVNLYRFADHNQKGLELLIKSAKSLYGYKSIDPKPLSYFNPPMTEYACYQGSLTFPPCTEAVLWLVRGRLLSLTREIAEAAINVQDNLGLPEGFTRIVQPLNDRKIYYFG